MKQNRNYQNALYLNGASAEPGPEILELGIVSNKSDNTSTPSKAILSTFGVTHDWASSETALIAAYLISHRKRYEGWSREASECLQRREMYWAACGWRAWRAEVDARWEISSQLKAQITRELRDAFGPKSMERLLCRVDWHQIARHILATCDHLPIPLMFRCCRGLRVWGQDLVLHLKGRFSFDTEI